jgi:hypothetical protein
MRGIIKETFQIYRKQLGKFIALSVALVSVAQGAIQLMNGSIQGMVSQGNSGDLFYYLYAAINKLPLQEMAETPADITGFNIAGMLGIFMLMMVFSFSYAIFITPIYSWSVIKLTQEPQSIGGMFQSLKGKYWSLILVALSQMVFMMGAGTVIVIIYMICIIPIAILGSLNFMGSVNTGLVIAFVVLIVVCVLLILAAIALMTILSMFIYQSFIIDDQRHFSAVGRSMKMGWQKFWPVLGKYMVTILIILLLSSVVGCVFALPILIANTYSSWLWLGYIFVMSSVTSPIIIILSTLIYQRLSPEIPIKPKKEKQSDGIKLTEEV